MRAQVVVVPPYPLETTFQLHSRPGADRVIYLDFDGESLTNTGWNDGNETIVAGPYDSDGNPGSFSDTERGVVQSVWQRVSEDYAPFQIDVTTEDPGFDAINRSGSGDANYGTRALITNMSHIADTCGCGGMGYIGTFDSSSNHAYYQPALVFQRGVGSGAKNIGEAASHEVGHNLGLDHDATSTFGYYAGQGAWAPIMGSGYSKPVTQWSKGEYLGADNHEDDFVVMAANGAPPVVDDVGNTIATAGNFALDWTANGVIGSENDSDIFRFSSRGGAVTVAATPAPVGPNLDIKLSVLNASGDVVATADPPVARVNSDYATGLDASITATLPAGTFYALVQGTGFGAAATTGYSKYASVGRYNVAASGALGAPSVASINDVIVGEGALGTSVAAFTITLDHASSEPSSFLVSTGNGTAASLFDFIGLSQTRDGAGRPDHRDRARPRHRRSDSRIPRDLHGHPEPADRCHHRRRRGHRRDHQ